MTDVVSEDGDTLTVAQTVGGEITAFDTSDDGSLRDRRVWPLGPTSPRTGCAGTSRALWVGSTFTAEFLRVQPGGRVTHRTPTPGRWALAPMLGGPDRTTLFLTTSETDIDRLRVGDMRGRIEVVEVDVPGAGLP